MHRLLWPNSIYDSSDSFTDLLVVIGSASRMKLKLRSYVNIEHKLDDFLVIGIKSLLLIWGLMLLASWTWKVILPGTSATLPQIEDAKSDIIESILASHWFGNNGSSARYAPINFKLVGVLTPTASKPGFAILKMADGKQRIALLKEEVAPGTKLEILGANYIEVGQAGNLTRIMLENGMSSKSTPVLITPNVIR